MFVDLSIVDKYLNTLKHLFLQNMDMSIPHIYHSLLYPEINFGVRYLKYGIIS